MTPTTLKITKRVRRAKRYRGLGIKSGICASMIWFYRSRLVLRYGFSPKALRGKTRRELFELLYRKVLK